MSGQEDRRSSGLPDEVIVVNFAAATVGDEAYTWEIDGGNFGEYRFETADDPHMIYGEEAPLIRKRWRLMEITNLEPVEPFMPPGFITVPWCVRCGSHMSDAGTCSHAPDRGEHEAFVGRPFAVRPGHSLHEAGCPRLCPLPAFDPPCTCRKVNPDV